MGLPDVGLMQVTRIKRRETKSCDCVRTNILGCYPREFPLQHQPLSARADRADGLFVLSFVSAARDHLCEGRCAGTQALGALAHVRIVDVLHLRVLSAQAFGTGTGQSQFD